MSQSSFSGVSASRVPYKRPMTGGTPASPPRPLLQPSRGGDADKVCARVIVRATTLADAWPGWHGWHRAAGLPRVVHPHSRAPVAEKRGRAVCARTATGWPDAPHGDQLRVRVEHDRWSSCCCQGQCPASAPTPSRSARACRDRYAAPRHTEA